MAFEPNPTPHAGHHFRKELVGIEVVLIGDAIIQGFPRGRHVGAEQPVPDTATEVKLFQKDGIWISWSRFEVYLENVVLMPFTKLLPATP